MTLSARQSNPQSAFWLDRIYEGLVVVSVDAARGTAVLGTSAGTLPELAIPSALVAPDSPLGVPIGLEEALGVAYEICVLVGGGELLLDLLYTKRALPFYRDLYRRLQRNLSVPWIVSLALMVGRLDVYAHPVHFRACQRRGRARRRLTLVPTPPAVLRVHRYWSVLRGWDGLVAEADSALFAARAVETLATEVWDLTPEAAAAVGTFATAAGLLPVRSTKADASICIADQAWIYLPGRDMAALSVLLLAFPEFNASGLSFPALDRARKLLGRTPVPPVATAN